MPAERLDLSDRVCLVTGAGRGIGLATTRELARRGARGLVVVDLPGDELEAATAGLGEQALAIGADVTDADAMSGAVAAARKRYGALDVVVANAGHRAHRDRARAAGEGLRAGDRGSACSASIARCRRSIPSSSVAAT